MTDPPFDAFDPDDLDGHTVEELAAYLDRGSTPVDPTIERSPGCRRALAALQRLRALSDSVVAGPASRTDDSWRRAVMQRIALDARAGSDFLLAVTPDGDEVLMTEGALRGIVRAAGDDEPGFLVGRVRFDGDLSAPDGPLVVRIDLLVAYGVPIRAGADRLRIAVRERIERHTRFRAPRIDLTVRDVLAPEEQA